MNKYIIFIPFGYTYLSRIKSIPKFISFILTIPIPCFLLFYYGLLSDEQRNLSTGLYFFLGYITLYIFYENGYIENDIKTVKKEENPTLRIMGDLYNYIDANYYKIIFFRIGLFALSVFFMSFFATYDVVLKVVLFSIITSVIYYLHNNVRSAAKVLTFFLLSTSRFIFPLLVFSSSIDSDKRIYVSLSILIYTVPALLIYSAKSFEMTRFVIGYENKYKIIYYFFMFVAFLVSYFCMPHINVFLIMAFILFYMLLLISLKKVLNK